MRGKNVPIDGNMLKEKADIFALRLNRTEFKGSDGWIQKFKLRHGLTFRKVCGESGDVDLTKTKEWKETQLKDLLSEYSADDVFNADETGLFYKLLPDRTLAFKGDSCSGGKHAKQRITVMMAANMSGSEKLPLLVIGKYLNPRCFKNIRTLPTVWLANKKAWMTADIYEKWLRDLDRSFHQKKRKILLIVDNCTAHKPVLGLQAIRVEFLPPNVTSVLQPMDQGVIQTFKKNYRRMILRRVILNLENDKEYEVDVLAALHLAVRAWSQVEQKTIANCFRHAGFVKDGDQEGVVSEEVENDEVEDGLLLEAFRSKNVEVPLSVTFNDFISVDNSVNCIEDISDDDIIRQALTPEEEDREELSDEEVTEIRARPSSKEVVKALSVVRRFFEYEDMCEQEMGLINSLEKSVFKCVTSKQVKITQFFCPEAK